MLPMMGLNAVLSKDRNTATFVLMINGQSLGHITLEESDVEDLIHRAAVIRASMAEPIPGEIEPTARLVVAYNPMWKIKIPENSLKPGVLLTFRHPGFGWLTNLLPRNEAQKLGQSLLSLSGIM